MDHEELLKTISQEIDEILELKKSWEQKSTPAAAQADALEDTVHAADHGETGSELGAYAKKLSDDELYGLLSALTEEIEQRGVGQDGLETENAPAQEGEPQSGGPEGAGPTEAEDGVSALEGGVPEAGIPTGSAPTAEESAAQEASESPAHEAAETPAEEAAEHAQPDQSAQSLEGMVAGLSDEELAALLTALEKEETARSSSTQEAPTEKNMGGMDSASMAMAKAVEESEKKLDVMMKSIDALNEQIKALNGKVGGLQKSATAPKAVPSKADLPTKTYAAAAPTVKVLEKSEVPAGEEQLMSGKELSKWLLGEQRKGNEKVRSDMVVKANLMKSEEDAVVFHEQLRKSGITVPKKKK